MTPAETAAWTSAGIAFCALLAVVVFGVLNLRQARRGPAGSPRWSLVHVESARYELVQVGSVDAREVAVELNKERSLIYGRAAFDVFAVGQRATYMIGPHLTDLEWPRMQVTWIGPKGARVEWSTDVPMT